MNMDTSDIEVQIERSLNEAVRAFRPRPPLKETIRRRLFRREEPKAGPSSEGAKSGLPNRKRRILRIVKWCAPAAAACVAAALVILALLPSPTLVESAYAELAEAMQKSKSAQWVHGVGHRGDTQLELWICLHPFRTIHKSGQNVIFDDAETCRSLCYTHENNTIRVEDSTHDFRAGACQSLLDYLMDTITQDRDRGALLETTHQTVNGRKRKVFTVVSVDGKTRRTLAVDEASRRLARYEISEHGCESAFDFDYPASGPEDIHALGVPRDAKVLDVRTRDDHSARLLARANLAKERFDKTFRAIVCEGLVDEGTGKMRVDTVRVYYQRPHKRRVEWWGIPQGQGTPSPDAEDVPELERYLATHHPANVDMTGPGGGLFYNLTHSTYVGKSSQPGEPGLFQNLPWQTIRDHYGRHIPDLPGPNGPLLGTRNVQPARVFNGKVHGLPVRWTVYLNPKRDYVAERYEQWIGDFQEDWVPPEEKAKNFPPLSEYAREPGKRTTTVLDYDKTPSGHWYPRRRLIEIEGKDGEPVKRMSIIHLDTKRQIPDEVFDAARFEAGLDRPIKSW